MTKILNAIRKKFKKTSAQHVFSINPECFEFREDSDFRTGSQTLRNEKSESEIWVLNFIKPTQDVLRVLKICLFVFRVLKICLKGDFVCWAQVFHDSDKIETGNENAQRGFARHFPLCPMKCWKY